MNSKQIEIANRLREIMVDSLRLSMNPEDIGYDLELFNEGLGLDSVDGLELVAAIDSEYGVSMSKEHRQYFKNLETLSAYILECLESQS